MYETAKQAFENYMGEFDKNNHLIQSKYHHTYQVVELMAELAFRLNLDREKMELAEIIGLLHDIGRFEQIKKFNLLSDNKTHFDHADESCVYLFEEGHIRDFIQDIQYDSILEKAIRNHNKFEIEEGLTQEELFFSKMIRDMDKVDIYRVLAVDFEQVFQASEVTEEALKEFQKEKTICNRLVKSDSDRTLVRLAFIFDMNFNESFDILVEKDNFDLFLSMVEVSEGSEKLWKKLREICFDKINRGIEGKVKLR